MPPTSDVAGLDTTWVCFTNNDLPVLFLKERKWTKKFQTTLLLWLGDQPNVWAVPEDNLIHALQEIIKVIYPTFTDLDNIGPNMVIFSVISCFCFIDSVLTLCIGQSAPFRMVPLLWLLSHFLIGLFFDE